MLKCDAVANLCHDSGKCSIIGLFVVAGMLFSLTPGYGDLGFGPPVPLSPNAGSDTEDDAAPVIAADGFGTWVAAWIVYGPGDVVVSRSTDNGVTWTDPQAIDNYDGWDMTNMLSLQLATDGSGVWIALWVSEDDLGMGMSNDDADLFFSRSADNGVTWSLAEVLNTNGLSDSGHDYEAHLAASGPGTWVAVWYSYENLGGTAGDDADIVFSRSTDNGLTWSPPALLNSYAESDGAPDESPRVANDGSGNWAVVWDLWGEIGFPTGLDSDIYISRSTDDGATWSSPGLVNTNATSDSGGDRRPHIAADGDGNWVTVWQTLDDLEGQIGTDYDILVSRSTDNGVTWNPPAPLNSTAYTDSIHDGYPNLTTDGIGNWVAIWQYHDIPFGGGGGTKEVFVSRSQDTGLTWSPPESLNSDTVSFNNESRAGIETNRNGKWIAVWHSDDNIGGTIGTDEDILFSTSTTLGVRSVVEGMEWTLYR